MHVRNYLYELASGLVSFPVDRSLKSNNIHVKNIENRPIITAARLPTYSYIHKNENLWRPLIFNTIELES